MLAWNLGVHGSVGGKNVCVRALHVVDPGRHVRHRLSAISITLVSHAIIDVVRIHVLWRLELSWEEDISNEAARDEAKDEDADDDADEAADWNAGNLVGTARVVSVQIGVRWLHVDGGSQSVIKLVVWIVSRTVHSVNSAVVANAVGANFWNDSSAMRINSAMWIGSAMWIDGAMSYDAGA